MKILNKLEFDNVCKKSTAGIALLAAAMLLSRIAADAAESVFAAFTGALAACGMLTLYFGMAAHALYKAASAETERSVMYKEPIFLIADAAALTLKLIFVLTPFPADESLDPLRLAVLLTDAALSRAILLCFMKLESKTTQSAADLEEKFPYAH